MANETLPIIHWINNNIDKESSLWTSFVHNGNIPNVPQTTKTIVYVTGSLEKMKEVNSIFNEISNSNSITILANEDDTISSQNLLRWMTICYIPPERLSVHRVDRLIAFTNGKPEKWIRNLLKAKKVAGLVGWTNQIIEEWEVSWNSSYDDFQLDLLTNDTWMYKKSNSIIFHSTLKVSEEQIERLSFALSLENIDEIELTWKKELDKIVSYLIEKLWEEQDFRMRDFSPLFLQLVEDYLVHIRDIFVHESNISRIELLLNDWIGGTLNVDETGE